MRLQWLLPFRSFAIESRLSPEEIVAALSPHIDASEPGIFGGRSSDAPWIGRIDSKRLAMRRYIEHRNSFLPQVEATIERQAAGARVRVSMRMHPLVEAFMAIWMMGALLGALPIGIHLLANDRNPLGLAMLGFPLFGLLLIVIGFPSEARHAETFLRAQLPPR